VIEVAGGRIAWVGPRCRGSAGARAAGVDTVAPGFVDLQINGGGGVLFNDAPTPATIATIARAARKGGTAHILPTFITDEGAAYARALAAVEAAIARAFRAASGSISKARSCRRIVRASIPRGTSGR
jgi:N-acetylglucosamine-6-phosphate deacetylase